MLLLYLGIRVVISNDGSIAIDGLMKQFFEILVDIALICSKLRSQSE